MERLSQEVESALILKAQAGDQDAMTQLLAAYDRLCWKLGKRFAPEYSMIDDFVQMARMHFVKAVRMYRFGHGATLCTWAHLCLQRKLRYEQITNTGMIRIPIKAHCEGWRYPLCGKYDGELFTDPDDVEQRVDSALNVQRVRDAMLELCDHYQRVLEGRMQGKTLAELGRELCLTKEAIRQAETVAHAELKAIITGADRQRGSRKWTRQEEKILLDGFNLMTLPCMAKKLGREPAAIKRKLLKMGRLLPPHWRQRARKAS